MVSTINVQQIEIKKKKKKTLSDFLGEKTIPVRYKVIITETTMVSLDGFSWTPAEVDL